MLSRRVFLAATGATLAAPRLAFSAEQVPMLLDHIVLGCNDLDRGIAFVEAHTGTRATFGGVHPGRGTHNALLTLGERRYLEIIAPDPKQTSLKTHFGDLKSISEPRLVGWAAHPPDADALAKHLREAKIEFEGPTEGSRQRPGGKVLRWKTLDLADNQHGLLPFFIEWSADSTHPSADAPKGCRVTEFRILTPQPDELAKTVRLLEVDIAVERGDKAQLHATITGPKGKLVVTS